MVPLLIINKITQKLSIKECFYKKHLNHHYRNTRLYHETTPHDCQKNIYHITHYISS